MKQEMENTLVNAQKDIQEKEDSSHSLSRDRETSRENDPEHCVLKSRKLVSRRVSPQNTFILNVNLLQTSNSCMKGPFCQSTHVLDNKIPKHVVTVDEKYLRRCLELIHSSASNASQCNISLNLGISSYGLNLTEIRDENTCDWARFVFGCPLAAGYGNVVISSAGQWNVGSIMGSKSMMHILKSPLLSKLGALEVDSNFGRSRLNDKGSVSYNFTSSPGGLSNNSQQKLQKETQSGGNHKYGSGTVHKRLVSTSSTNSTSSSDQSNSSASTSVTQGMLQCTWKGGIPHFVFSLDDQREVYVANLCRVESVDDKALDYMYLFNLKKGGGKEHGIHDNESHLVGKMKVSTSFTLCPNSSKIMEREFILFAGGGTQTSCRNLSKNKGLSKKVVEAFRNFHSSRQRNISKFNRSSSILEYCPWEPYQDTGNNFDALGGANLLEDRLPPDIELAAIVVKHHLPDNRQHEVGGWGLKFLRKVDVTGTIDTLEASLHSACTRDTSGCSTSMDVLVPAGLHGGPRTRNGGPSSLIERWKSGGCCDCGGWDLGCPLTVLNARSDKQEISPKTKMEGECKLFDLFIQGSEHGVPKLRMVNVHGGLYFIHFQSTLSALQSFAIAVAYIHSQSPTLRPKKVQELMQQDSELKFM